MNTDVLERYITITPGIAGGKPHLAGHRITVRDIAIWYEQLGKSVDEICSEYDISLSSVHAALAYYFDHREEIHRSMKESDAFVQSMRQKNSSKLLEKLKERSCA
ncbi:MAG: DUF433 domain-containing protein [Myxococcota bacterium]